MKICIFFKTGLYARVHTMKGMERGSERTDTMKERPGKHEMLVKILQVMKEPASGTQSGHGFA
jgi:hypothetical protein